MERIVIAGIDTVAGANFAAWFSERCDVAGVSFSEPVAVAGCETVCQAADDALAAQRTLAVHRPDWVIYCGPGARSSWELSSEVDAAAAVAQARSWGSAAATLGCEFTALSSDAVFTGPWMFHRENSETFCESAAAQALRAVERELLTVCPQALIARTNVFGWSPFPARPGLIEMMADGLTSGDAAVNLDCVRHATPILATDLAEVLELAVAKQLRGVYHIGGAERVNPFRFAALLACRFDRSLGHTAVVEPQTERRRDFGCGETSLQSRKIRNTLGIALPLLNDALDRLRMEHLQGFPERLRPASIREALVA